jgi:hypothetical protein
LPSSEDLSVSLVACASSLVPPIVNLSVDEVAVPRDASACATLPASAALQNEAKIPATPWNPTPVSAKLPVPV